MNRREFFKATAAAGAVIVTPIAPEAIASAMKVDGIELSVTDDLSGYKEWCILRTDGKTANVYLNGLKMDFVRAASEKSGYVIAGVKTPNGRLARDMKTHEFLEETLHGDVRIEIIDGER